ncbi:MAG: CoA-binding protein [Candidatus Electrothrix sp. GW3-4]|uniref:CoA-binding protein n=1 Tax=Candidatus Electrothrix sp. GW3-4 TaxID=3126740 RepID=UPI0030D0B85C
MTEVIAIIGATDKPERYANKAMHALRKHEHEVVLVNPFKQEVEGQACLDSVADHHDKIDTVTLYVNPKRFEDHIDAVIKAKPTRVIMNPGTEDDGHQRILEEAGIEVVRACTLVLLSTNQF